MVQMLSYKYRLIIWNDIVTEEVYVADRMAQNPFLTNMLTALKGSQSYFYLLLLQLVLCRVATVKSLPVHHP